MTLESQTADRLARDAFQLAASIWTGGDAESRLYGGRTRLHVVGIGMGGMVAQRLALLLLRGGSGSLLSPRLAPPRLCSLTLAATARSLGPVARFLPLSPRAYRSLQPLFGKTDPQSMVASLLRSASVPESYLASPHPRLAGRRIGDLWEERWVREYTEWFSFWDRDITAAQARGGGGGQRSPRKSLRGTLWVVMPRKVVASLD